MRQARFYLAIAVVFLVGALALQIGPALAAQPPGPDSGPMAELTARVAALEGQVTALQTQVTTLQTQVTSQQGQIATLQTQVGDLTAVNTNQQIQIGTLQTQVAALQSSPANALAEYVSVVQDDINELRGPHIIFEGVNVHVRNGSGHTIGNPSSPTGLEGLGNLVVGYNEVPGLQETPGPPPPARNGSHNLVVGFAHEYTSDGGLVAGIRNIISNNGASVTGGCYNHAGGYCSSVTGGIDNTASSWTSSVTGGVSNNASGDSSSVSGGKHNIASGEESSISGGRDNNTNNCIGSSVLGGLSQSPIANFTTIPPIP